MKKNMPIPKQKGQFISDLPNLLNSLCDNLSYKGAKTTLCLFNKCNIFTTQTSKPIIYVGCFILTLFFPTINYAQKKLLTANEAYTLSNKDFIESVTSDNLLLREENNELFNKLYSIDGPFGIFKKESEIISLRSENSKSFQKNDGSIVTVVGAGEYHYKKNGLWHTIVDYIHSNQSDNFPFANIYNKHQIYFGKNDIDGIRFKSEIGEKFEFFKNVQLYFLDSSKNVITTRLLNFSYDSHDGNKIYYKSTQNNILFCLEKNSLGFKTSYQVSSFSDFGNIPSQTYFIAIGEEITFPEQWKPSFSELGTLNFKNSKNKIALKYNRPLYYSHTDPNATLYGKYLFHKNTLLMAIDINWLSDPGTSYPIIFDPTVTYTPDNITQHTGTVEEDGGCTFGGDNDYNDEMRIGFDDGSSDNDYYSSFARFNISGIPDANCIINAYTRYYQFNWNNANGSDNNLKFYYQYLDPSNFAPTTSNCTDIYNNLNSSPSYSTWDVFGTWGGLATDYDENTNNQWKDFLTNVSARVQSLLTQDWVIFGFDNARDNGGNNHSDPAWNNNDEWLTFRGRSDANRPQLIVTHEIQPTVNNQPSNATICIGGTYSPSISASGGGTLSYQWQYNNGGTWVNVSNGTPANSTYSNPTSVNTFSVSGSIAVGTYEYRCVVSSTGSGCSSVTSNTATLTIIADPSLPTINTISPNESTVCEGTPLMATFNPGTGGTGCTDAFQYSINGGASWSAYIPGDNIIAGAGGTTVLIQGKRDCSGDGCDGSAEIFTTLVSWNVVADPLAPTATMSPSATTICDGQNITLTSPIIGNGGTGTCYIEYRYSLDNGSSWTTWSTTVPSFTASVGTNIIELRTNCNGNGCDISSATQYAWTVVADPSLPTINVISPNVSSVCPGEALSATFNIGTGGTDCNDSFQYSTNGGTTWLTYSPGDIITAGISGTTVLIQGKRDCTGNGCDGSAETFTTLVSWTVIYLPNIIFLSPP